MITWFRYVTHSDVGRWLAKGWTVVDDLTGTNHGHYSVLMKFEGDGDPA